MKVDLIGTVESMKRWASQGIKRSATWALWPRGPDGYSHSLARGYLDHPRHFEGLGWTFESR